MDHKELILILENALKDKEKSYTFYRDFFEQNSEHKLLKEFSSSILCREQQHQEILKTILAAVGKKNSSQGNI